MLAVKFKMAGDEDSALNTVLNLIKQKATIVNPFHNEPSNSSKTTSFDDFFSCDDNKCDQEQHKNHKRPSYLSSVRTQY